LPGEFAQLCAGNADEHAGANQRVRWHPRLRRIVQRPTARRMPRRRPGGRKARPTHSPAQSRIAWPPLQAPYASDVRVAIVV
jgi:hypothetical protein